jgi:hypothetical protein
LLRLDNVSQLVDEQALPGIFRRSKGTRSKVDVVAEGERASVERLGRTRCDGVSVNANVAEVGAQPSFHVSSHGIGQRLSMSCAVARRVDGRIAQVDGGIAELPAEDRRCLALHHLRQRSHPGGPRGPGERTRQPRRAGSGARAMRAR